MSKWKQNESQFTGKTKSGHSFSFSIIAGQCQARGLHLHHRKCKKPSGVPEPALPRLYIYVCQDNSKAWRRFSPHMQMLGNTFHRHAGRKPSFVLREGEHGGKHIPELLSDVERLHIRTVVNNSVYLGSGSHLVFDVKSFAPLLCSACKCFPPKPKKCLNSIQSPVSKFGLQSVPVNWIHGMLCLLIILLFPVKQGIQETTQEC